MAENLVENNKGPVIMWKGIMIATLLYLYVKSTLQ